MGNYEPSPRCPATRSWANWAAAAWDLETGQEPALCLGTARISSLALSGNGKRLFSGSGDQTIKVWDVSTAQ
jgi:WD40 repeat protein